MKRMIVAATLALVVVASAGLAAAGDMEGKIKTIEVKQKVLTLEDGVRGAGRAVHAHQDRSAAVTTPRGGMPTGRHPAPCPLAVLTGSAGARPEARAPWRA